MAEGLRPELAAVVVLHDLQTASLALGVVVAEALVHLERQVAPDPDLTSAVSEAVHQAHQAERALVRARRAVAASVGPLLDPPDGGRSGP